MILMIEYTETRKEVRFEAREQREAEELCHFYAPHGRSFQSIFVGGAIWREICCLGGVNRRLYRGSAEEEKGYFGGRRAAIMLLVMLLLLL